MKKDSTIRVGGVPEHFNLPWHLAMEKGLFADAGLKLTWKDHHGGTGAMTRELRHGQLDIAVLLTEGMTADIIHGSKVEIVQFYVSSPLTWGLFVDAKSDWQKLSDKDEKRFAVSRIGSGSHLMASVFASEYDFKLDQKDPFKVVGNLDGAVTIMNQEKDLLFLWEEFTTKHLVDQGVFRMIDKFETPWPCFVIAVRKELLQKRGADVAKVISIMNQECAQFMKNREQSIAMVSERYGLSETDTTTWFDRTSWQCNTTVDPTILDKVMHYLKALKMIDYTVPASNLCSELTEVKTASKS